MVLLVAASLPLAALSVWFSVREMRSATELAGSQLRFAASLIAAHQDRTVEAAQHLLGAISAMPMMRTPERIGCEKYFEAVRGTYPIYANIGILNTEGQVVCHARGRAADFNAADRSYFQRALAERRFVMGEPIIGRATGRFSLPFAQPVFDGERVAAIAFAVLDLEHASEALAGSELPFGAQVIVTDRRGTVLMERPAGAGGMVGRVLAEGPLLDAARHMSAGTGEWDDAADEPRIHAYVPSRVVAGEGFLAEVSMDRDQVQRAFLVSLRNQLLVLGVTLLVGFALAWWIGGRVIVGPAKQILATVRRLEQGRLEARVPLRPGPQRGEFARIGAAFNLMAESLQVRQRDLESELGRSRSAYLVLDQVLNSMQESLIAVTGTGRFLMFNEAAGRLFPLSGAGLLPQQWAQRFGFYHPDRTTLYRTEELPLVRSARGESGRQQLLFVRNASVPEGRLLQCSWQPIRSDGGISGGLVVFSDVTELERLQAEQAAQFAQLRETQRKLIEAQRIGRTGNWELDLATGRLWWSDEVYKLFGVDKEGFDGSLGALLERVHPDDRGLPKLSRDAALRDGGVVSTEFRTVKPDGEVAWMHEIAEARRDDDGQPVWFGGIVQDITGRKRDEEALQRSERELQAYTLMLQRAAAAAQAITAKPTIEDTLRQVVEQARLVIGARMAMVGFTPDGDRCHGHRALSLAGAHQEWHGLEPGAESSVCASGQPLRLAKAQHAGGHSAVNGLLAVPLAGRDGANIGLLQIADKELGDFSERDEYVAMELAQLASIAIENARLFTQIRELNAGLEARIAERTAELARQEQLFRTLAEQAPEVVWNTDPQGRATFLNRAWYDLVGGNSADGLGHRWMKRLHPDDVRDVKRNWSNSRDTQQPYSGIRRFLAQDGSYHTMSYRAAPVLDENGGVVFWVGIDADITELKAIEQALRSSNQELEAFSYSVSHDLRAPLGAVTGFSSALALKLAGHPDERVAHYLARIQAAVGKMEQLIEALLSLARVARAPLRYARVDLGALAREALETLQLQEPQRNVTVQVEEGLVAQGDSGLLRAVMENLLGNAWKFTSQREEARIEVGRVAGSGVYCVRDNGVGFDMAYAAKLFGAFQRLHTEAEFPGTGVGLATVRRIVARHQGRVWAESRVGEGAAFFFTLSEVAPPAWLAAEKS